MLCGWHTRSDLPLTAALPMPPRHGDNVDIVIQLVPGPSPIAHVRDWNDSAECTLYRAKDIADFEVASGQQIRFWPVPGVTEKDIEISLFGSVWGILCHQRRILPLHASAIVTGSGITAFAGYSGVGKSTTAALMGLQGYALVADDILPISFRNAVPGAWPYLRRLKLQRDAIAELALVPGTRVGERFDRDRYFVCPQRVADDTWRRVERIFLLEIDPKASRIMVDQVTGPEAVQALVDQTYRLDFILDTQRFADHVAYCARLASEVEIYRVRRGPSVRAGQELASSIRAHLGV
jgi:hypothetical protein